MASETLDDETITDVGVEFRSRLKENNDALIIRGAQIQITEQPIFQYNLQEQGMRLETNSDYKLFSSYSFSMTIQCISKCDCLSLISPMLQSRK